MFNVEPLAPVEAIITPELSSGNARSAVFPALSRALESSFTTYSSNASAGDKPLVNGNVCSSCSFISSYTFSSVSYTHLRAHETPEHLVCRLLLEKKKKKKINNEYC